ncbi:MAG: D-2-hydroxyacid dehydrogenase family protein [Actinomycetota bacterium]|nr:D-2-hydroxyacid dehydrogenase family protein [Actinomycetota bacterium]
MPIVTILDDYQGVALTSTDWSRVRDRYTVEVVREHIAEESDLLRRLQHTEIVVVMRERTAFPASVLGGLPTLRLLVTPGMTNAAIDLDAARERGIVVSGTGGTSTAVPELTMGMIIALTRNFAVEDAHVRAGGWQHTIGPGLAGATLGIVGLGRLGVPVAGLAQAFGMSVLAWSPNLTAEQALVHGVRAVDKQTLFAESDVVTIHMPLSERSRGLIGADDLARMKATAYLINTSRGPIVDEAALVDALQGGRIAGAGLDVYDIEPLPGDHPLRRLPNTLLLPHIGYVTTDTYRTWYREIVEDILAWTAGAAIRTL